MAMAHTTNSLDARLERARVDRNAVPKQIALDEQETISVRRQLEKAETPIEARLLEDRLARLRDRLSELHASLVRAHTDYDSARREGLWGEGALAA